VCSGVTDRRVDTPLRIISVDGSMQTVILAAGQGTRMRPLTDRRPKPVLPVAGRPLVAHTAETAVEAGASKLVVVVGYEATAVREYIGSEFHSVPVEYANQTEQRGTADAVLAGATRLDDGPFAVLNGDNLYDTDSLAALYDAGPSVGTVRVDNPSAYGVLDTDGETVSSVIEKPADPPSNRINTGAYVFPAEATDWLDVDESDRGELELTDVLDRACATVSVSAVPVDRWLDVGRPWELLEANEWLLETLDRDLAGDVADDAEMRGDVVVEPGATVEPGVVVEGPTLVSAGATVGPNAYVRGATLIGADVSVGHGVEIKNSVLMEGTNVSHLSYVGDSVLGREVNFGAGTTVANLRHDDRPVSLTVKGERVSTGRRKFGVVCGDGAKTGINTSLNTGVTLSTEGTTEPGAAVTRDR
jgi:bifunctional UDP-N-acetylglucosamine pyrophosphorylase/glucosamine-1-phosphate N-acetyltransferase